MLEQRLLETVSEAIADLTGLHFPPERWPELDRGLLRATEALGFADVKACHQWLVGRQLNSRQIELLASHLTVGETYFLRDPDSFELLEREILPALAAERQDTHRGLRLWSAGCCTGEEAYSLAITCLRAIPDAPDWNIAVLGTDINPRFLAKAEAGTYGAWSFRGPPPG